MFLNVTHTIDPANRTALKIVGPHVWVDHNGNHRAAVTLDVGVDLTGDPTEVASFLRRLARDLEEAVVKYRWEHRPQPDPVEVVEGSGEGGVAVEDVALGGGEGVDVDR